MISDSVTYHLVRTANKDGDGLRIGAVLNDEHLVAGGTERDLPHDAGLSELGCCQVFEPGDDAAVGRDRDELQGQGKDNVSRRLQVRDRPEGGTHLDFRTADPSDGGQVVLHQEVVRFVVKAPLADDEVGARVLDLLDHALKLFHLVLLQLLVLLDRSDIELVLGLGSRRFEWAGEDGELGVFDGPRHLRMRHVLVEQDALDQGRVLERTADLARHLDQVEWHVPALEVGHGEDGVDGDLGKQAVRFRNAAHNAKDRPVSQAF